MAGQLKEYGYQILNDGNFIIIYARFLSSPAFLFPDQKDEADLWVLNSCTVKTPAEDHLR
jgi:tRNA A37 methylthiotransferase MiaB